MRDYITNEEITKTIQFEEKETAHAIATAARIAAPVAGEDLRGVRVSVSERNLKMGNVPSFSTLPGAGLLFKANGNLVSDVPGTCHQAPRYIRDITAAQMPAACEGHCYACRLIKRYPSVAVAYARNTRLIREEPERAKREILAAVDYYSRPLFRFHVSGEIETPAQGSVYNDIAAARPDVQFAIWTHLTPELYFPGLYGGVDQTQHAPNLHILKSVDHAPTPDEYYYARCGGYALFVYDDGSSLGCSNLPHCPNVTEGGKHNHAVTCDKCRKCWSMVPGEAIAVYAH